MEWFREGEGKRRKDSLSPSFTFSEALFPSRRRPAQPGRAGFCSGAGPPELEAAGL
jgi:hypothetical protein